MTTAAVILCNRFSHILSTRLVQKYIISYNCNNYDYGIGRKLIILRMQKGHLNILPEYCRYHRLQIIFWVTVTAELSTVFWQVPIFNSCTTHSKMRTGIHIP